jgi:hypothetical protein
MMREYTCVIVGALLTQRETTERDAYRTHLASGRVVVPA